MSHRVLIGALAAGLVLGVSAPDAEAWHQRNYGYGYYRPGPPPPPYYRYYDEDFDQGYYDPYYEPPRKLKPAKQKLSKKKRLELQKEAARAKRLAEKKASERKKAAVEKKAAAVQTPMVKTAKPEKTTSATPEQTASISKPAKPKSTAALSCEKAGSIISGYGFSAITASKCEGPEYTFNAAREGKSYAITLNATSGELTEVRKVR